MKEANQGKTTNSAIKWGVLSALVASLCCVGPLVLILLGVGGASTALSIGYRKPYFLAIGLAVLGVAFYRIYRKTCCEEHLTRKQQLLIFSGAFLVAALLYYLLTFIVTPLAAPFIYQLRFGI